MATLNLTAYDGKSVPAEFKAEMLEQTWFFNALVKTASRGEPDGAQAHAPQSRLRVCASAPNDTAAVTAGSA